VAAAAVAEVRMGEAVAAGMVVAAALDALATRWGAAEGTEVRVVAPVVEQAVELGQPAELLAAALEVAVAMVEATCLSYVTQIIYVLHR
jgi:hypothetical protein